MAKIYLFGKAVSRFRIPFLDYLEKNGKFITVLQFPEKAIMKRKVTIGIAILLFMCVGLGNVPFRTMLVCVHGGGGHGEKTVHLHYGQLPGQPCHESPAGFSHTSSEEGRRHFSIALETLITSQASFKRTLSLLPSAQLRSPESTIGSPAGHRGGYRFYDPSFVFLDTAFINTTILII